MKVQKAMVGIKIFEVGKNLFLFEFESDKHMCKVWEGQLWMFDMNLFCNTQIQHQDYFLKLLEFICVKSSVELVSTFSCTDYEPKIFI